MGVIRDSKEPTDIETVRIFFKDSEFIDISCDDMMINNITDEIILYKGDYITARFFKHAIAGYLVIKESDYKFVYTDSKVSRRLGL